MHKSAPDDEKASAAFSALNDLVLFQFTGAGPLCVSPFTGTFSGSLRVLALCDVLIATPFCKSCPSVCRSPWNPGNPDRLTAALKKHLPEKLKRLATLRNAQFNACKLFQVIQFVVSGCVGVKGRKCKREDEDVSEALPDLGLSSKRARAA